MNVIVLFDLNPCYRRYRGDETGMPSKLPTAGSPIIIVIIVLSFIVHPDPMMTVFCRREDLLRQLASSASLRQSALPSHTNASGIHDPGSH